MLGRFIKKLSWLSFPKARQGFQLVNLEECREFMSIFKVDEYGHRASITQADLGYGWMHYGLLRTLRPRNILCVGSRHGYVPALLAQACKDSHFGHVYFVDAGYDSHDEHHWSGVGYWKSEEGKRVFAKHKLEEFITLFVMTTKEFHEKYSTMQFDYIYIDGNHSYQGAKTDYEFFWPNLAENGFMGFHDVNIKETLSDGEFGVYRVWNHIKSKERSSIEFPFLGSGLGLVQKRTLPAHKEKRKSK